jgi:preprotein translocase subunit SecB
MEKDQGGIKIIHIILLESQFRRVSTVTIDGTQKLEIKIEVGSSNDSSSRRILSEVTLNATSKYNDEIQIEAKIKMAGIFEYENVTEEFLATFSKINGPSIIFPFVREHLTSLMQKAGVQPIIINPVNFVELARRTEEGNVAEQKS